MSITQRSGINPCYKFTLRIAQDLVTFPKFAFYSTKNSFTQFGYSPDFGLISVFTKEDFPCPIFPTTIKAFFIFSQSKILGLGY